jgi:cell division protein FtsW
MVRYGHVVQMCVLGLLGLGLVMVHSAGADPAAGVGAGAMDSGPTGWRAVFEPAVNRHTAYAGLAVLALWAGSRIDVGRLLRPGWKSPVPWLVVGALGLVVLTQAGPWVHEVNGARRWLKVGPVTFQPSEAVKWAMVLGAAWWCGWRGEQMRRFGRGLGPALAVMAVACGLIVLDDLGTAALIGGVAVVVLVAGGARLWQVLLLLPLAAGAVVAAVMAQPYRIARLTAFRDPWADPRGAGYHPIQSMLAFAEGGPWGSGLGHGVQKYFLPEDTTDFIFPILAEELGLAGAAAVVGLLLVMLWVGMSVVREREDLAGRLLGLGVLMTVGLQAAINIAVVTVVVPTKGIALPLVSAGGTGWVLTAGMLGLLAGMERGGSREAEGAPSVRPLNSKARVGVAG